MSPPAEVTAFDPRGIVEAERLAPAPRVGELNGLRLGVLDNTKWNAQKLLRSTVARLQQDHRFGSVSYYRKASFSSNAEADLIAAIAADNDVVLTAIGD